MVIVSQDKKYLVNFDNIIDIRIDSDDKVEKYFILFTPIVNIQGIDVLAIYETEERAKEVLEDLIRLYRKNFQVIGERGGVTDFIHPPKVYEMPKE